MRLITISAAAAQLRATGGSGAPDRVTMALWWAVIGCIAVAIVLQVIVTGSRGWLSLTTLSLVVAAVVCLLVILGRRRSRRGGFRGIRS